MDLFTGKSYLPNKEWKWKFWGQQIQICNRRMQYEVWWWASLKSLTILCYTSKFSSHSIAICNLVWKERLASKELNLVPGLNLKTKVLPIFKQLLGCSWSSRHHSPPPTSPPVTFCKIRHGHKQVFLTGGWMHFSIWSSQVRTNF